MGGSITVPADEEVIGNVTAMGGSVDISGHVTGNASALGGSVYLRRGARVDGQVTAVGGRVVREEGATVGGNTTEVGGFPTDLFRRAFGGGAFSGETGIGSLSTFFYILVRCGFLALLAALLLPRRLEVMARALPLLPARAALYGTLGLVLTPAALVAAVLLGAFIIVVLCITIVGILAIPAVPAALAGIGIAVIVFGVLGSIAVMLSLGQAILGRFRPEQTHVVAAAVIGAVVVSALCMIPVVGTLVLLTVMIFGYGLALMTGLGSHEEWASQQVFHRRPLQSPPPPPSAPPAAPSELPGRVVVRSRPGSQQSAPATPLQVHGGEEAAPSSGMGESPGTGQAEPPEGRPAPDL
jgi:hypothetical protein